MFDTVYKPTLYALIGGIVLALISQLLGLSVLSLIFVVMSLLFLILTLVMTKRQEKLLAELPEFTREKKKKKKEELYDLDSVAEEEKELERYKKAKAIVDHEVTLEKMYLEKGTFMYQLRKYVPFLKYEEPKLAPLNPASLDDDLDAFGFGGDGLPEGGKLSELSMGTPEEPTLFKSSGKYVTEQPYKDRIEPKHTDKKRYTDEKMNELRESIKAKHEENMKNNQREYVIDLDEDDEVWVPGMNMRTGKRENTKDKKEKSGKKPALPTLNRSKKNLSNVENSDKEESIMVSGVEEEVDYDNLWNDNSEREEKREEIGTVSGDLGGNVGIFNSKKEEMFIPYGEDKTSQADANDEDLPDWLVEIQKGSGKSEPQTTEVQSYESVSSEDLEESVVAPEGLFSTSAEKVHNENVTRHETPAPAEAINGEENIRMAQDPRVVEQVAEQVVERSGGRIEEVTTVEEVTAVNVEHVNNESSHTQRGATSGTAMHMSDEVEELFESLHDETFTPPYVEKEPRSRNEEQHETVNDVEEVVNVEKEIVNTEVSAPVETETTPSETVKSSTIRQSAPVTDGEISAPVPSARFLRNIQERRTAEVEEETLHVEEEPKLARSEETTATENVEVVKAVKQPSGEKHVRKESNTVVSSTGTVTNVTPSTVTAPTGERIVGEVLETETVHLVEHETMKTAEGEEVVEVVEEKVVVVENETPLVGNEYTAASTEVEVTESSSQPVLVTQPEVATIANQIAALLNQAEEKAQDSVAEKIARMEREAEEERKKLERNWEKILEKVRQEALEERKAIEAKAEEEKLQLVEEKEQALEAAKRVEGEKAKLLRHNENLTESLDEAEENLNKVLEAQSQVAEAATMSTKLQAVSKLRKIRQESENADAPEEVVQMLDDFINDFRK